MNTPPKIRKAHPIIDADVEILEQAFRTLGAFVERELKEQVVDWSWRPDLARAWKEMRALHRWWTVERPARKSPLEDKRIKHPPLAFEEIPGSPNMQLVPYDKKKYAAYHRAMEADRRMEASWEQEDQRNLRRLVEVRPYLWI